MSRRTSIWSSPITAMQVTASSAKPGEVRCSGETIVWSESRPAQGGRMQLVRRRRDGHVQDLLPDQCSARSRVHEYGGGAWAIEQDMLAFCDDANDGRVVVVRMDTNGLVWDEMRFVSPPRLPAGPPFATRFGDLCFDWPHDRLFAVRERHEPDGRVVNEVVSLALNASNAQPQSPVAVVAAGADFYGQLALNRAGTHLACIRWNLPDMPWDATELLVINLSDGHEVVVAGGPDESIVEPQWLADGTLTYSSDRTGWWNLYQVDGGSRQATHRSLAPVDAEIGGPLWVLGNRSVAWLNDGRFVASMHTDGFDRLVIGDADGSAPTVLDTPFTHIAQVIVGPPETPNCVVVVAGGPTQELDVYRVALGDDHVEILPLRDHADAVLSDAWISTPEAIRVPTPDGGVTHAILYRPLNPEIGADTPQGLPPLLVLIHGGPTSGARVLLNLTVQFWTSRGFCVADVNYRGSTGFGRPYRDALRGKWGVVDVADCVAVARALADRGVVDPKRLGIRGGSAGGFTTLAALCTSNVFTAGMSAYGIGDLGVLAQDTHKFESRYLDRLVGPYPEAKELYDQRSPLFHLDQLHCPIGILQGAQDAVVPPAQADAIVAAVQKKGLAYGALTFAGEGHGFRKSENIIRALECELWFFAHAFGLTLDESIEPMPGRGLAD